jgi:hypothetical protein
MKPHPEIAPLFIATWLVLGIAGIWLMFIDKNVPRKKRLLPVFIIGTGAAFVIFVFLMTADLRVLAFVSSSSRAYLAFESPHDKNLFELRTNRSKRNVVHESGILFKVWRKTGFLI